MKKEIKLDTTDTKQIRHDDESNEQAHETGTSKDFYFQGAVRGGSILGNRWYTTTRYGCFSVRIK